MTLLISTTRAHLPRADVAAMIAQRYGTGRQITDSAALAIAAGWQSPGGPGATFAQLASTGQVDFHALNAAITAEYGEALRQGPQAARELDMLATWALFHPSRRRNTTDAYIAANPVPAHLIRVGMTVSIPLWHRGQVRGWANGQVITKSHVEDEPYYTVQLPHGSHLGYYGYSIGYPDETE
jgi:hypothetical protein